MTPTPHDSLTTNLLRGNTATLVLAILRDGSAHGYAIAAEINRRSDAALEFKQGTLYPLLHELEREQLIASEWEIPNGERPRRVYTITDAGRADLDRRLAAWQRFNEAMTRVTGVRVQTEARSGDESTG